MLHLKIVHHFLHIKQIIDVFINEATHIYIAMLMYNFIEYSDNYSDTPGNLWQLKKKEVPANNADVIIDNFIEYSESFEYKAALGGKTANAVNKTNSSVKDARIIAPLQYLRNFWRSLEMPLINCKIHLELNWIEECNLSSAGNSGKFETTDVKLHVPIVTLSTKVNVNLTKQVMELEDLFIGTVTKIFLQKY